MRPRRVLIADDERHIARYLRHHLEKAGYETRVVERGDEVPAAAAEFLPDVFLLDVEMPGADGADLCGKLRLVEAHRDAVFVLITAHARDADAAATRVLGADWRFPKPIGPGALLAKLRELGAPPVVEDSGGGQS